MFWSSPRRASLATRGRATRISSPSRFSRWSLARTSCSARARSAPESIPAIAEVMTSLSTPLASNSAVKARLLFPALARRDRTHCSAKSMSSTRPTAASRFNTRSLTSLGYPRFASWPDNSARVRDRAVSRRRHNARACSSRDGSEIDGGGQDIVTCGVIGHNRANAKLLLDLLLDLVGHLGVLHQEAANILLTLAELLTLVGEPGTGLSDKALVHTHIDQRAFPADASAVEDVELGLLERRRDLVFDDLDPGAVADRIGAVLECLDPAHVHAHRRVELQRLSTGRGFWTAEHDPDLLAELVDEDRSSSRITQRASHFP